ncbi:MAG: glycosyltransferase family 2 protein, partial [Sphingomicrobium sp.]
ELMPPAVSVILNCYNHEGYVAEAVESVLGQTFTDFELILIDNGSTDGGRAILERYNDPRIRRFFHDENQSLSKRLNEGVVAAAGEFVAVLYSDDLMLPDKLERQVSLFGELEAEYGVVYCPALGFNQLSGARWTHPSYALSGQIAAAQFDRFFDGPIDMSSPLTRTRCFREHPWHEDLFIDGEAVFLRIAAEWKFHFDPTPTVMLRDHDGNLGKAIRRNGDMHLEILDRLERSGALSEAARQALRRHRARYAVNTAWSYARLDGGDRRWLRSKLSAAARSSPAVALRGWRFPATLALAVLPARLGRAVNRLGDRLRSTPANRALVDG